jgi:hypothetical protein
VVDVGSAGIRFTERTDTMLYRALTTSVATVALLLFGAIVSAQTSLPGAEIDLEVYNPADGSNAFCVSPTETFTARVFLRPGTGTLSCTLSCSPPDVAGGSANIATAVVDVAFDSSSLSYVPSSIESNASTVAVQGLPQEQNVGDDRIGWALAGNWSTPGDPNSTLLSPCDMQFLTTSDWIFELDFQATAPGLSSLHLRRETDAEPFALSFADICGTEAFKQSNGGIDEVKNAVVMVAGSCSDVIFFDTFDTGGTGRWSETGN